ncbi:MAG: cell division ATP-binding protein FtsE [Candidatus Pacebacteria bacterium]|nr:cell division ATP-binding protein FtsE [Candidatus Paceibacterota bacterium]
MIKFDNISKSYESKNVSVHGIDLKIEKGEFVILIGPSGAGKTTLLRLLLAEEKPTSGSLYFDTVNIHNLRKSDIPKYRQRIGVVFQDYKLLEGKTVFENVAFAMEMIGKTDAEIKVDVPYALELVGLENKGFSFPHQLSGGEQQRLAIARAIINQPDVLIADEPTGSLDPESSKNVLNILNKINDLGTTVILATHDRDVVDASDRRIVRIEHGRITRDDHKGGYHPRK